VMAGMTGHDVGGRLVCCVDGSLQGLPSHVSHCCWAEKLYCLSVCGIGSWLELHTIVSVTGAKP
jgi:hypothetical protein